jgi:PAS domain S-box-containing protein
VTFYFDKFKSYAQFLLKNKELLEALAGKYFEKIRNSNIPMMRFLEHLPAGEHKKITDKNIESFLQHSLDNTAFEDAVVIVDQWKADNLFGVPKEEVEITDILTVTNFRKQLYIDFLDRYTQDLSLFRSIVSELDAFHMQFQKYAFDSYVAIHQEALANENQFVSSLINNSVDGILAFDKQLKITEINQVLEKWHGIKKEDVVGKEILQVFAAYSGSREENPLAKALKGERTFIPESPFLNRKGVYEANIAPLYDSKGQITGGIVITHDITKRKEAEKEIRDTKQLLQEITDAVPNVIYVSDFATKKNIFVNKEITSLSGYSQEEVKSFDRDKLEQFIHPDDIPALQKQNEEIFRLKNGEISELDVRIKHKDGRWCWLRTKCKIFKHDDDGRPLQIIRVFEDITNAIEAQRTIQEQNEELASALEELQAALEELQTAEEQLREMNEELEYRVKDRTKELAESESRVKRREEQLRLITDAVPVLIAYLKTDKTYDFVNKAYERSYKRKKEEIIGKPMWETIGIKAYNNKRQLIEKALKGEYIESQILQEYDVLGKKWIKIAMVPHIVKEEVVGIFTLVEDITEFKNIQLELEEKNHELERTNTDLDNFIYTASHDLKSPITNMEGLMSLLKDSAGDKLEQKEVKLLEMLEKSVQKLQKTIGDLVKITKVQKEIEEAREESLQFSEVIKEVKEDIYGLIQDNNILLKENIEVENIQYKRSSLRSILYNLLSNAIKYRNPARSLVVELKTYIENDDIVLSVKDNGLGLNPNQQKKLFTLFRRMHHHVEGTGVGLFMIKRIVENMGGRIEVKSEEGKGTEFIVFLAKARKNKM